MLLGAVAPTTARAEWWVQTPSDSCISRELLVERLRAEVDPAALQEAPLRIARVELDPLMGRIRIAIRQGRQTVGQRTLVLRGVGCDGLVDGAVFVLVTLMEGQVTLEPAAEEIPSADGAARVASDGAVMDLRELSTASPSPEDGNALGVSWTGDGPSDDSPLPLFSSDEERAPVSYALAAGAEWGSGRLPGHGFGPTLSLAWRRGHGAIRFLGGFRRAQRIVRQDDGSALGEIHVALVDVAVVGSGRWRWAALRQIAGAELCGGLRVGAARGEGRSFLENTSSWLGSMGASAEAALVLQNPRLFGRFSLGAPAWLARSAFLYRVTAGERAAYTQAPVSLFAGAEVGVMWGEGAQ